MFSFSALLLNFSGFISGKALDDMFSAVMLVVVFFFELAFFLRDDLRLLRFGWHLGVRFGSQLRLAFAAFTPRLLPSTAPFE